VTEMTFDGEFDGWVV